MARPSKHTTEWLLLARVFLLAAIWQAHVTTGAARNPVQPEPTPPRATRHAVRPTSHPEIDPVTDYIALSEKGISDQEIRWIAEDFIAAGLDRPTDAVTAVTEVFNVRAAQDRWYLSSLTDALGLTPEQSAQAATKLAEFTRQAREAFTNAHDLSSYRTALFVKRSTVSLELMPWKLCDLDTEQEKITSKRYFDVRDTSVPIPPAPQGTPDFHLIYQWSPFGDMVPFLSDTNLFESVNILMPLLISQKLPQQGAIQRDPDPGLLLDEIRRLHPAQLKILMMLSPAVAGDLLNTFNARE